MFTDTDITGEKGIECFENFWKIKIRKGMPLCTYYNDMPYTFKVTEAVGCNVNTYSVIIQSTLTSSVICNSVMQSCAVYMYVHVTVEITIYILTTHLDRLLTL